MSRNSYPAIPEPAPTLAALYASIAPMKQAIEMIVGTRGSESIVASVDTLVAQTPPYSAATQSMTSGYNLATYKIPATSGVIRLDARQGLTQKIHNLTITDIYAPFNDCVLTLLIENLAVVAPINWNGFSGGNHGDAVSLAAGAKTVVWITRIDGVATYWAQALQ